MLQKRLPTEISSGRTDHENPIGRCNRCIADIHLGVSHIYACASSLGSSHAYGFTHDESERVERGRRSR